MGMVLHSGVIIYFFIYLLHRHPAALLLFSFFLTAITIIYVINNKNVVWHRTLAHHLIKKHRQNLRRSRIKTTVEHYRTLATRPKLTHLTIPLIITLAAAYILLNNMLFFSVVTSNSMQPVLEKNDLVLIQNIYVEPQQGDIIMFDAHQRLPVIHRIHAITPEGIKTKGDAAENPDNWLIHTEDIRGEAVLYNNKPVVIKNIGAYFNFDTSRRTDIKYSQAFHQVSTALQRLKKMGLIIFIICILYYLIHSTRR